MSHRWPGWSRLPGIEIAPMAQKARESGEPYRAWTYTWAYDQRYVTTCGFQVDADGTISIPWDEHWEPVTEDGMLTGFRRPDKPGQPELTEQLVRVTGMILPDGQWSPALQVPAHPDAIGAWGCAASLLDVLDIEDAHPGADKPCAAISINFGADDGSLTQAAWGITRESAVNLVGLIRDRYGEPLIETIVDAGNVEAFQDEAMAAVERNAISTGSCGCEHEDQS